MNPNWSLRTSLETTNGNGNGNGNATATKVLKNSPQPQLQLQSQGFCCLHNRPSSHINQIYPQYQESQQNCNNDFNLKPCLGY